MNAGDKVKITASIRWDGRVIPRGARAAVERVGSSGCFIRPDGWEGEPAYAFRSEMELVRQAAVSSEAEPRVRSGVKRRAAAT